MKKDALPLSLLTPALIQTQTNRIRDRLTQELNELQQELKHLPRGRLYIKRCRKWISFCVHVDGQTRGITKDKDLIYKLARRQYIALLVHYIEAFLDDISCDLNNQRFAKMLLGFDMLFARFEKGNLDIDRITMTPNQYIWNSDRESKKPNRREELIYPTNGRVYMRTKSEQMLGNLLERLHMCLLHYPWHSAHSNGTSRVCTIMCADSHVLFLNYSANPYGISKVCAIMCADSQVPLPYFSAHPNGISRVCAIMCADSYVLFLNYSAQPNGVSRVCITSCADFTAGVISPCILWALKEPPCGKAALCLAICC